MFPVTVGNKLRIAFHPYLRNKVAKGKIFTTVLQKVKSKPETEMKE